MPPRLARLLAVIVAVAVVVAAFAIRGALSDDDASDETTGGPEVIDGGVGEGSFDVLCDADLGDACDALRDGAGVGDVTVMTGAEVLVAYAEDPPPFDAWLTLDPLPAMLAVAQVRTPEEIATIDEAAVPVASAPATLYAYDSDVSCPDGAVTCVVDAGATEDIGVPDATTSAGLVFQAGLAGALVPDLDDRGTDALDSTTRRDLVELLGNPRARTLIDQLNRFLTARGTFGAILTTSGLAARQGDRSGLVNVELDPTITVGVVLSSFEAEEGIVIDRLSDTVLDNTVNDALATAGWDGVAARSSGLPEPDIIYALQEELG